MKENISADVVIPTGVTVTLSGPTVTVKGPKGELTRKFPGPTMKVEGNKITFSYKKARRKEGTQMYTTISHIKNMMTGVVTPFKYEMKICASHFPITVAVDNGRFLIKNYLGEKTPRVVKMKKNIDIKIKGQDVTIESCDLESAGSMASDIEVLTRRKGGRDVRVFQDGLYITKKGGMI